MDYAIIKLGNKQHRVRDGETLVVDRVSTGEGESFEPVVLLGDGKVTATVIAHERGPKILVGKYRRRTGYKRHVGFRAATSRLEITLGAGTKRAAAKKQRAPKAEETPKSEEAQAPESVEAAPVEAAPVEAAPVEAAAAEQAAAPVAEAEGAPSGYESMTVARIAAATKKWSAEELEAALAYEKEHANRKGAISALEAALRSETAAAEPASEKPEED